MPFDRQRHRSRYQLAVVNLRRTVTLLMTLMLLGSAAALAGQAPSRAPVTTSAPLAPVGAPYQRPQWVPSAPQLASLPYATMKRKSDTVIRLSTAALVIIVVLLVLLIT